MNQKMRETVQNAKWRVEEKSDTQAHDTWMTWRDQVAWERKRRKVSGHWPRNAGGRRGTKGKNPIFCPATWKKETAAPRTRGSFALCCLVCTTLHVSTTLEWVSPWANVTCDTVQKQENVTCECVPFTPPVGCSRLPSAVNDFSTTIFFEKKWSPPVSLHCNNEVLEDKKTNATLVLKKKGLVQVALLQIRGGDGS